MTSAAYAASGIGWTEAAEMLYQALRPFADQIPHVAVTTSGCQVNHYLGLLAASLRQDCGAECVPPPNAFPVRSTCHSGVHQRTPTFPAMTRCPEPRSHDDADESADIEEPATYDVLDISHWNSGWLA
jgi:hypothetical protein